MSVHAGASDHAPRPSHEKAHQPATRVEVTARISFYFSNIVSAREKPFRGPMASLALIRFAAAPADATSGRLFDHWYIRPLA
jgi:hypothetical protein